MKKALVILSLFVLVIAVGITQATAADINVTVTIDTVISLNVNLGSWSIGSVAQGGGVELSPQFSANNDGNVSENFYINSSGSTGGWNCGSPAGVDSFAMAVTGPPGMPAPPDNSICGGLLGGVPLASGVAALDGNVDFVLEFTPPTITRYGGTQHSITVLVTAEAAQ
jgi:hypothetical protein